MQTTPQKSSRLRLTSMALGCQLACLMLSAAHAQTAQTAPAAKAAESEGTKVTITGGKLGMGLMVQEEVPRARSTITEEEIIKQRPTGNVFQAMDMMPAVNSYNHDASGLFGGGLTMRGFNSDQIGATVNGVPVNDSGNFAVFPQEYVDSENVCKNYVTQGSTDVDSPHVGASGGNIGIVTCAPKDKPRLRIIQALGSNKLSSTFLRYDTGLWADKRSKLFFSFSHKQADKWKGEGKADRDHVDIAYHYDIDRFNYVHSAVLYNKAINNNINNVTLAELNSKGYHYDYSPTFTPGHLPPVKGTAQNETGPTPAYYKLAINPFENMVASATIARRFGEDLDIKVIPYYWFGYGTGGIQQRALSESGFFNPATGKLNGGTDLNGDGDTLDRVVTYNGNITRTSRPGVTASVNWTVGDHQILAGLWYEKAEHRQTGPAVAVNADGSPSDPWLREGQILRPNGTPYQSRDWKTISPSWQLFLQDTVSLMNDRLLINVGVRAPHIKRDFTNYANEGTNSLATYNYKRSFSGVLPQIGVRYRINNNNQLFASLTKNMKAPPNFVFATTGNNMQIVNTIAVLSGIVKEETAYNLDVGYRHQSDALTVQASLFSVDFKNRQANAFDVATQKSSYTNAGDVKNRGFELEIGNKPVNGWSFYGSLAFNRSEIMSNLRLGANALLPTQGKEFPLTPKMKFGLSAQYETGVWYARLKGRHTSTQWATLVNDEEVPSYKVVDFDAGYQFPSVGALKNPTLRFNISNLLNAQYRNPSSQSVTNATAIGGASPGTVRYYLGAPRFASATITLDF